MTDKLCIPKGIFDEMIAHCKAAHPNEACGILAGNGVDVFKIYKMSNIEKSPVSYEFDSREHINAIKNMRENNHKMLAIFHSHPSSPAYPSAKDVSLAFYEDSIYVIVSLSEKEPVVKGFLIREGAVKEVRISVK
ncbi:MAG: M67 family metallopeptidase [Nitrospirae bacterium]|nr:M67 family metallopeptidase [Nitrospirota bacterium]MBI3378955.1 M67 family metallopeptidase [Nitrospirota bacterium]